MEKLTDLEICKKIAEIEGQPYVLIENRSLILRKAKISGRETLSMEYNPLKDDALCFQLMVKHKIKLEPELTGDDFKLYGYVAAIPNKKYTRIHHGFNVNPNKAICLAIIKVN